MSIEWVTKTAFSFIPTRDSAKKWGRHVRGALSPAQSLPAAKPNDEKNDQ